VTHCIDFKSTDAQHRNLGLALHPVPQRRTHPRQQLTDIEGLVDVVVGAEIERFDLFDFAIARGQNNDRHIGPFATTADDILAVAIGQSEIEQHNIRRFRRHALDGVGDGASAGHFVIVCLERGLEESQDCVLVIDN